MAAMPLIEVPAARVRTRAELARAQHNEKMAALGQAAYARARREAGLPARPQGGLVIVPLIAARVHWW